MGRKTTEIFALGQPEQKVETYQYSPDNTLRGFTNSINQQSNYTYDANLNLTQLTQLAGTSTPAIMSFSYETAHNQMTTGTDPLGHTTTFTIDPNGNTTQVATSRKANGDSIAYNPDGRPATITDSIGQSIQLGYDGGDVASMLVPSVGQASSIFGRRWPVGGLHG